MRWVSMEVNVWSLWRQLLPKSPNPFLYDQNKTACERSLGAKGAEFPHPARYRMHNVDWCRYREGCCAHMAASGGSAAPCEQRGKAARVLRARVEGSEGRKRRRREEKAERGGILSVTGIEGVERGRGGGVWEQQRWG